MAREIPGLHLIKTPIASRQIVRVQKTLLSSILFAVCSLGVASAQAPPRIDRAALSADLRERADRMADRLALTPTQRERAFPVIRNSLMRRWSALSAAWTDGVLDNDERTRLRNQFELERRGVVVTLRDVLSEPQITQFRRLQAEETSRFHEEFRQGRYSVRTP